MQPTVPTSFAISKVPSTKAWLLLVSLLTTLLMVNHQVQPGPGSSSGLAGRRATAPRQAGLSRPAPQPRAVVTFATSASL